MEEEIMVSKKKKKVIKKNQNFDQKVAEKTAQKTAQKATQKEVLSSISKPKRKVSKKTKEDINFENVAFRYDDGRSGADYNAIMKSICAVFAVVIVIVAVLIFMFIRDNRNKKNNLYLEGDSFVENISEENSFYDNYNNEKISISIEEETETTPIIIPETETIKKTNEETIKETKKQDETTSKETIKETEKETVKETEKETESETKKLSETQKKEIKIQDVKGEDNKSISESISESVKASIQEKETKARKLKPEEVLPNFTKALYSEAALLPYTATEMKSLYTAFKGYAESDAYKKLSDDNKYLVAANMKFIDNYVNTYKAKDHDNYLKTDQSKYLDIIKKTEASILKDDAKFYYRSLPLALVMDKAVDRGYYYEIPATTYSYIGAEKKLVTLSNEKVYIYKNARIGYGDTLSSLAKNYLMYPEQINYELYASADNVCKKTANNPNLLFDALVSQQQIFDSNGFIISLMNIDEKG